MLVRSHLLTFNVSECHTMLVNSHLLKVNAGSMNFKFSEPPRCQSYGCRFAHIRSHFVNRKLLNVEKMFADMGTLLLSFGHSSLVF